MVDRKLITAVEVADKLCRNIGWFYRERKTLETHHGFPGKVPGCGNRWDPAAIDRWLDRGMPDHLRSEGDLLEEEQKKTSEILERRGALIARGISPGDEEWE